jgi:glycosyltransferase involved in cell wall biosynthesis
VLRRYLKAHASNYDVVEYDHGMLPFPRTDFPGRPLFVARSVLLRSHLPHVRPEMWRGLPAFLGRALVGSLAAAVPNGKTHVTRAEWLSVLRKRVGAILSRHDRREAVAQAQATLAQADMAIVSNAHDRARLLNDGIADHKIAVLPFGLDAERRAAFGTQALSPPKQPTVAFVGTYDFRKGGADLPEVAWRVAEAIPDVRFLLLGTRGLFQTEGEVKAFFPRSLHGRLEVVPSFKPEALPTYLKRASVGVFPSYYEGFPFGVLEMLAAALPVVAYDAPGPPEMLDASRLVAPGDVEGVSQRLVALLRDTSRLRRARREAHATAHSFTWEAVGEATVQAYRQALALRPW